MEEIARAAEELKKLEEELHSTSTAYGISIETQLELQRTGRWPAFKRKFVREKRKELRVKLLKFICPKCKEHRPDLEDWPAHGKHCKKCGYEKEKNICNGCHQIVTSELTKVYHLELCKECLEYVQNCREAAKSKSEGEMS